MSREVKDQPDEGPDVSPAPEPGAPPVEASGEDAAAPSPAGAQDETGSDSGPTDLERALAEAEENQNRYLRTAAELDNFRKRTVRIRSETRDDTLRDVLLQVAPLLDNFRRALGQEAPDPAALREGIEIIFRQFIDILSGFGLEEIEAEGQAFDPNQHEAMLQMPSEEHPPGTVMQEMEKGYKLNGRVIRPSRVVVSAAPVDEGPSEAGSGGADGEGGGDEGAGDEG